MPETAEMGKRKPRQKHHGHKILLYCPIEILQSINRGHHTIFTYNLHFYSTHHDYLAFFRIYRIEYNRSI